MFASRANSRLSSGFGRRLRARVQVRRSLHDNRFFKVSEEVREAVATKKPVVALESAIYTHGYPLEDCMRLPLLLESLVRANGGVPATVGILNGVARVGLGADELYELASTAKDESALKVSRRDLAYICGLGAAGKPLHGGTTISATMVLAHLAGIKILGTGGLGGVHQGGRDSMDISADLTELGRTPVTVISSGCGSFFDIPRTLEYLETEGVCVATFADGREGTVEYPSFFTRDSGIASPKTIRDEVEAAAIIYARSKQQISSGIHFANPVAAEYSIPKNGMEDIVDEALYIAFVEGYEGSEFTPFVLSVIKQLGDDNGERALRANRALIEANVKLATKIAAELSKLEQSL